MQEIKNISILGLGLIGGSIAKALKKSDPSLNISAYDYDETIEAALNDGMINSPLQNYEESLEGDLIFICLPVGESIKVFKSLVPKLKAGQVITDVCGVKSMFQEIWDESGSNGIYVGGHPMTGKEKSGYKNSDPLLFENAIYILTQDISTDPDLVEFKKIIEMLGANILTIPAHQHDVIAASVSHLPQLVSVALVNTASLKTDQYNFLDLAAGGFRDMTRIASSDFKIWEAVINENRKEILTAIEKFVMELNNLKKNISERNYSEIGRSFESARKNRDEIPSNTKGFLSPLHDIFVFVKDEPGVISKLSTALFNAGINIKDMELLKIREGSGGTFRLSFQSSDEAANAKEIIKSTGFKVD